MTGIIQYNLKVINQLQALLYNMEQSEFTVTVPLLYNSTIGKHCRHILEFYQCFFKSVPSGQLNYDLRERNMRLETETAFALDIIQETMVQFANLPSGELSLELSSELPEEKGLHCCHSTLARELSYLADHTVHHLAIIKIGLAIIKPGLSVAEEVGIAASTINNNRR
jgi:uncharacterized damage-inducible protein DinB